MKKYFIYELKKNWLAALILAAFATVFYITFIINADFQPNFTGTYVPPSLVAVPLVTLMLLCTFVPAMVFSYKMNARQTDCFYALPLRREKVYLIKSAIGLLMVLVPYTVAYWLGFIATAAKPNAFELWAFIPAYFISIPLAVMLFGFNAFIFTRANRQSDGTFFVVLYACVGVMLAGYVYVLFDCGYGGGYGDYGNYTNPSGSRINIVNPSFWDWFTYSPLTWLANKYTGIISNTETLYGVGAVIRPHEEVDLSGFINLEWLYYLFAALTGIAAWAGLFLTARKEKAENAERVSDTWFGYRIMLPTYLALGLALLVPIGGSTAMIFIVIVVAMSAALYIIYRRSVKLKLEDIISLVGAVLLGLLLAIPLNS
ncbi:MAG: hypothetical protein FWD58_01060 [Firmicutes bacterium]|nr:hypothetical protein [Bacillota bacterium]